MFRSTRKRFIALLSCAALLSVGFISTANNASAAASCNLVSYKWARSDSFYQYASSDNTQIFVKRAGCGPFYISPTQFKTAKNAAVKALAPMPTVSTTAYGFGRKSGTDAVWWVPSCDRPVASAPAYHVPSLTEYETVWGHPRSLPTSTKLTKKSCVTRVGGKPIIASRS